MANSLITPLMICQEIRHIAKRITGNGETLEIKWWDDIAGFGIKFAIKSGDKSKSFTVSHFDLSMALDPFSEKYLEEPVSEVVTPHGHDRAEWC